MTICNMGQNMSKLGFAQENIGINPYQAHQYTQGFVKSQKIKVLTVLTHKVVACIELANYFRWIFYATYLMNTHSHWI